MPDKESRQLNSSSSDVSSSKSSLQTFTSENLTLLRSQNHGLQQQCSELPSNKFQFSLWHDLKNTNVKGNQLKAPRIRIGPYSNETKTSDSDSDDSDVESAFHDLHGKAKLKHRDKLEKWERAELASFGYQELQHNFQKKNLYRVLARLRNVKYLNLAHNSITDLSSFTLSKCEYLNLNNNFIASFKGLPKIPRVKHLTMTENNICGLDNLKCLRSTLIEELYLNGNPVTFTANYRKKVFALLPNLQVLDGVYKLKTDTEPMEEIETPSSCVIS